MILKTEWLYQKNKYNNDLKCYRCDSIIKSGELYSYGNISDTQFSFFKNKLTEKQQIVCTNCTHKNVRETYYLQYSLDRFHRTIKRLRRFYEIPKNSTYDIKFNQSRPETFQIQRKYLLKIYLENLKLLRL